MLQTASEDSGSVKVLQVAEDKPLGWLRTLEMIYPNVKEAGSDSNSWVSPEEPERIACPHVAVQLLSKQPRHKVGMGARVGQGG